MPCSAFAVALFVTLSVAGAAALAGRLERPPSDLPRRSWPWCASRTSFFVLGVSGRLLGDCRSAHAGTAATNGRPRRDRRRPPRSPSGYSPELFAYQALNGSPDLLRCRPQDFWYHRTRCRCSAILSMASSFWTPLWRSSPVAGLMLMIVVPQPLECSHVTTAGAPPPIADARGTELVPELRRIGVSLLLMIALQVYISGAVESWTVAGAFGQRCFVGIASPPAIGLAALRDRMQGAVSRPVLNVAIALCIWWNIALIAEAPASSMMNRQRLAAPPRRLRRVRHPSAHHSGDPAPILHRALVRSMALRSRDEARDIPISRDENGLSAHHLLCRCEVSAVSGRTASRPWRRCHALAARETG